VRGNVAGVQADGAGLMVPGHKPEVGIAGNEATDQLQVNGHSSNLTSRT
jgi:hypothetical protein